MSQIPQQKLPNVMERYIKIYFVPYTKITIPNGRRSWRDDSVVMVITQRTPFFWSVGWFSMGANSISSQNSN